MAMVMIFTTGHQGMRKRAGGRDTDSGTSDTKTQTGAPVCLLHDMQVVIDRGAFPGAVLLELFADGHFVTNIEVCAPLVCAPVMQLLPCSWGVALAPC